MLELKKIKKTYNAGGLKQNALNSVSIKFRKSEFVCILGPSGSGKTTLLNVLGGLDNYDDGDLIINGKSTRKFKSKDWDEYRNNVIGFIFQSYNLIGHISVLANVELSLKLSSVPKKERRKKALEVLEKVGLKNHIHKQPNELSGGQMQRVAIARSLVNDPEIILADEPTGALDTKTSKDIMDLIKKVSDGKLVIMVTHNETLAKEYATRIINLEDGKITGDTNPYDEKEAEKKDYKFRKTKMSFKEALLLSLNNILTKKGRTLLTAFASSIGIIGIALILALSNGFDKKVNEYEKGIMSAMPIIISKESMNMDEETISNLKGENKTEYPGEEYVVSKKNDMDLMTRTNNLTKDYINYIMKTPKEYAYGVSFYSAKSFNIINEDKELIDSSKVNLGSVPYSFDKTVPNQVLDAYYEVLKGRMPQSKDELVLIVNAYNEVDENVLKALSLDGKEKISFDEILNSTLKIVPNDSLYKEYNGLFIKNNNMNELYENSINLKVVGIIRAGEQFPAFVQNSSLCYTSEFNDYYIDLNENSKIVKEQRKKDYNILTGMPFDESMTKEIFLSYLGADELPMMIYLYPKDFESKDDLLKYLDDYNTNLKEEDKIVYIDQAEMISSMSGSIMSAITIVLVAFSSISLVVSSIMIGIITYISVLERTKEIGVLRSLGARKKDITRVFNAETFIIGITSGLIGVAIALLLTIPANIIIYNLTDLKGVASLNPLHAVILIIISMTLTLIGGYIPARIASKNDPVKALRTE
ncbi:MAG: ATP-binding cassette domain-containing protein [Tenericutes bacterium]|nr:ATP-binding cassette domain-containing protein [Mycoplasmatota bacterium]